VVEKPFVPLMPHKQYNSTEQSDTRMRKRSRGCKLLFRHRDGWKKDVGGLYHRNAHNLPQTTSPRDSR